LFVYGEGRSASELGYIRLGSAYYAMGFEKYALKAWEKALKINPSNADLIEFMGKNKEIINIFKVVSS